MLNTDQVTRSLIREFLIRRNMKTTIKSFDMEFNQEFNAVSRIELIKSLCMERLIKLNKEQSDPRQTLIEMLVDYLLGKSVKKQDSQMGSNATLNITYEQNITPSSYSISNQNEESFLSSVSDPKLKLIDDKDQTNLYQPPQVSRLGKMKKTSKPDQYYQPAKQKIDNGEVQIIQINQQTLSKAQPKQNVNEVLDDINELDNIFSQPIIQIQDKFSHNVNQSQQKQNQQQPEQKMRNMKRKLQKDESEQMIEDIVESVPIQTKQQLQMKYEQIDLEKNPKIDISEEDKCNIIEYDKNFGFKNARKKKLNPIQIDSQTLIAVKKTIFQNSGFNSLPKSWSQGFILQNDKTFYGLLQKEGGPCGVIAAVQAYYIKHNLMIAKNKSNCDIQTKQNCLIAALSDILFKISRLGTKNIVLVVPSRASNSNEAISLDACEQIILISPQSIQQTFDFISEFKELLIGDSNNGVTVFFYSLILTKGIETIKKEMDNADNSLIGNHGHCTQEAVNLLLTGYAVSNCFDGTKILDEDYILKGIPLRSEFGFLTIFEHLNYMQVGQNLKSPIYPIWVICKEYHYSVIFGTNSTVLMNESHEEQNLQQFDLIFYDELYAPDDLIRLTIRRQGAQLGNQKKQMIMGGGFAINLGSDNKDDDLTPSIELVLRTKWGKDIEVDWNDSMPIL